MCLPRPKVITNNQQSQQNRDSGSFFSTMSSLPEFKPQRQEFQLGLNGKIIHVHPLFQHCKKSEKHQNIKQQKIDQKNIRLQKQVLKELQNVTCQENKGQQYFELNKSQQQIFQKKKQQQQQQQIDQWDLKSISSYADTLEVHRHSYEKDDDFEDFYEDFDFEI